MNSYCYFQSIIFLLSLLFGGTCKTMAASEQFNVENYLIEAKECLNAEGSKFFDRMESPSYLQGYLEQVEAKDYVGHTLLDPKVLSIDFRKHQNEDSFSISLYFDLDKDESCGRISIYEILG